MNYHTKLEKRSSLIRVRCNRSIERDMKTVSSALEYSYKVNKEANAQLEQSASSTTTPTTSANQ